MNDPIVYCGTCKKWVDEMGSWFQCVNCVKRAFKYVIPNKRGLSVSQRCRTARG